jgi:hypothetical protein
LNSLHVLFKRIKSCSDKQANEDKKPAIFPNSFDFVTARDENKTKKKAVNCMKNYSRAEKKLSWELWELWIFQSIFFVSVEQHKNFICFPYSRQLKHEKIFILLLHEIKFSRGKLFAVDLFRHLSRNMCVLIFLGKSVSSAVCSSSSFVLLLQWNVFYAFLFMLCLWNCLCIMWKAVMFSRDFTTSEYTCWEATKLTGYNVRWKG